MWNVTQLVTFLRNVRLLSSCSKKIKGVAAPLQLQLTLTKEAFWSFETSTIIFNSTRCNTLEDLNLNLKILLGAFSNNAKKGHFFWIHLGNGNTQVLRSFGKIYQFHFQGWSTLILFFLNSLTLEDGNYILSPEIRKEIRTSKNNKGLNHIEAEVGNFENMLLTVGQWNNLPSPQGCSFSSYSCIPS